MALKHIAAFNMALLVLLSSFVCPVMSEGVDVNKEVSTTLPLSLSSTSGDRIHYFLPSFEKALGADPVRDASLILSQTAFDAEFIPVSFALPDGFFITPPGKLTEESISPRAP